MQDRTGTETRWGMQTGFAIGLLFGMIALTGYWISPSDYQRHVPVNAPLMLIMFITAGCLIGIALAAVRHVHATRNRAVLAAFVAATPMSAAALIASHGSTYLSRGAHWLVIVGVALAAPAIASGFWPDPE